MLCLLLQQHLNVSKSQLLFLFLYFLWCINNAAFHQGMATEEQIALC
jgi:hypothetical protein